MKLTKSWRRINAPNAWVLSWAALSLASWAQSPLPSLPATTTSPIPTLKTPNASSNKNPFTATPLTNPTTPVIAAEEKISLNFANIEVRSLLQVFADFTHLNLVIADTVTGSMSVRLKDIAWEQALDTILQAKHLVKRQKGNVLWIAPEAEMATKDRGEIDAQTTQHAITENAKPLPTHAFQLNYTKAPDVAAQIMGSVTGQHSGDVMRQSQGLVYGDSAAHSANTMRLLSSRGSLIVDARTNQLFVTDTAAHIAQLQALIRKIDIPVRQVLIEARIVEANASFGKALGVKLGGGINPAGGVRLGSVKGSNVYGSFGSSYAAGAVGTTSGDFVSLPAVVTNGARAATMAFSLFGAAASRLLNLEISALESEGQGRLISSPRVVTADQTKALIEQGTEFPYQQATASGATSVSFKKANLKLEVTPQITPEGRIILDIDINKDAKGEVVPAGVAINTKHIRTQVLVDNGGTIAIGGIFELAESTSVSKVPLLGDIPVVGNLFKSQNRSFEKTEMLVFITPQTLVDATYDFPPPQPYPNHVPLTNLPSEAEPLQRQPPQSSTNAPETQSLPAPAPPLLPLQPPPSIRSAPESS